MTELEQRALDAIDVDALLTTLGELVAFRSLDGEESAIQHKMASVLSESGFDVDLWAIDFDTVRQHSAYCEEIIREEGVGLVGSIGSDSGKSLILNGHVDVVPVGDHWTQAPWKTTVIDGKVYGRGALDMKGGLCCAIEAARAIRRAGIELNGKLMIQSVIGEEDGGVGTLATCLRGYSADAAIIMEPTELMIAPAQAGCLNFRIEVPGRAAHGAVRLEGVSAIENAMLIYKAVMAFEKERNAVIDDPRFAAYEMPYPICIGTIQGGNWASTVAELVTMEGRYGTAVGEDSAEARAKFEAIVAAAAAKDDFLRNNPPRVSWWGGQFEPAGIDTDHPIVSTVADAFSQITDLPATLQGMTYGADMRLLVNQANTPTIMFGPGDVRKAHQPDEYVPLNDLITVTRTLTLTILRFLGAQRRG